jgi:uncharacterized protein (DUF1697 family)
MPPTNLCRSEVSGVPAFVVLLRGVNVSGKNKLPMADLRAAAEAADFGNVRTYVQSGNLVLNSSGSEN